MIKKNKKLTIYNVDKKQKWLTTLSLSSDS